MPPRKNKVIEAEFEVVEEKSTNKPRQVERVSRTSAPSLDPESREKQLIAKAVALAERQLEDGTASAAVIVHYLKMASKREVIEREILEKQKALITAKTESISQVKENEQLAKAAIEAMKQYGPSR